MEKPHNRSSQRKPTLMQRMAMNKRLLVPAAVVLISGVGGGAYYLMRGHATPEQRIEKAKLLEQAGDHKAAIIEIKNALQKEPTNGEARFLLGRIHFANGEYENAEKELHKAISEGYKAPEALILLARSQLHRRQAQPLIDEVNVIPGAPADSNAAIMALRAHAYLILGDKENMAKSLDQADELAKDHPDTLSLRAGLAFKDGQMEQSLSLIESAITKANKRTDLLVMKAELLRVLKRDDEAFKAYTQTLAIEPGNIPARLAVVQHHLKAANLDKASEELKALHKFAPNNLMARYLEGLVEFQKKNLEAANSKFLEVLRVAPDFLPANLLAGTIALSQDKRENAITHLNRVLEVNPNNVLARKMLATAMLASGQAERAKELIANLKPDDKDAQLLSLQGNIALRQGSYQEARSKLEKAAALTPDNTALIRQLAASRMASGDESGAVEALNQLAEKDSTTHQADVILVMTHVKSKRFDEAIKVVDALEKRQPHLPLAENLRGTIYLLKNDQDKARAHFTKALALDPGYMPSASNLARLDMINKDIKSARQRFQGVLKKEPGNARAMIALAQLAAFEKNEPEFLSLLEQAKKAEPKHPASWQMLARYWIGKRDAGKALLEARSALDATGSQDFLDVIGAAQLLQNDIPSALTSYTKWAEAAPNNPLALYRLAMVQNLAKDRKSALNTLDKVLVLNPDNAEASATKAVLLGQDGKQVEGLKVARNLQSRLSNSPSGYLAEAELQVNAKKTLEAAKLFSKAAQVSGRGQYLIRAYNAYAEAGQKAEGEKQLGLWLKAHADDAGVRHVMAQNQLNDKQFKEASENYRILVKANPNDLLALNNLAWSLGELKDPGALAIAEQAYKLAPKNAAVLDTYGWQLAQAGQAKRAIPHLQGALAVDANNIEIRWHLAATLEKTGDKTAAIAELDRVLSSHVTFSHETEARELLARLRKLRN